MTENQFLIEYKVDAVFGSQIKISKNELEQSHLFFNGLLQAYFRILQLILKGNGLGPEKDAFCELINITAKAFNVNPASYSFRAVKQALEEQLRSCFHNIRSRVNDNNLVDQTVTIEYKDMETNLNALLRFHELTELSPLKVKFFGIKHVPKHIVESLKKTDFICLLG